MENRIGPQRKHDPQIFAYLPRLTDLVAGFLLTALAVRLTEGFAAEDLAADFFTVDFLTAFAAAGFFAADVPAGLPSKIRSQPVLNFTDVPV
jgi:hypothetical protein